MERVARWIYGDVRGAIQTGEYDPVYRARRLKEQGHGEYARAYAEATAQMLEDYAQRHRQAAKMVLDGGADGSFKERKDIADTTFQGGNMGRG